MVRESKMAKKILAILLVVILIFPISLIAKERRGANLVVEKKNGLWVKGELITVKPNSLLLLSNYGTDVSVGISDIKVIKIEKKSKWSHGLLIGAGAGAIIGLVSYQEPEPSVSIWDSRTSMWELFPDFGRASYVLIGGLIGGLIGLVVGAAVGADKTIQVEGRTESEIRRIMEDLRKKARVSDFQ